MPKNGRVAIFGSFVLAETAGAPTVLRNRWVVTEGGRIAAVTASRPAGADSVLDAPGRFVLPGLLNLHNHSFSEAIARTHTEDGGARRSGQSIVYAVLLPLSRRGLDILTRARSGWRLRAWASCNGSVRARAKCAGMSNMLFSPAITQSRSPMPSSAHASKLQISLRWRQT